MSVTVVSSPAASGKTRRAVRLALECAAKGERVIALTLPNQREFWLEALAAGGPSLGVEVTNLQNICYRMLDRLGRNCAVVLNPGRVALTARALETVLERAVQPGEARLYARAIASFKRAMVIPDESIDAYRDVLARTYAQYQHLLETQELQDLDDVRLRAARFLSDQPLPLNAHLIVDGYRSLNRSELEAIKTLSRLALSTLVTLPSGAPDTHRATWAHETREGELRAICDQLGAKLERLPTRGKPWAGLPARVNLSASANPVSEARACLRRVKSLLQDGSKAQDIAIIVPSHIQARVLEALAREYSVTLAPESLGGLLETSTGRVLDAALSAPVRDYPAKELRTLSALEPDLAALSDALEARGLHGGSASYDTLIEDTAQLEAFARIKTWIQPPEFTSVEALIAWFERLLERIAKDAAWLQSARVVARETVRLLHQNSDADVNVSGAQFADWLRTLLQAVAVAHPDVGRGVALLTPEEASGRRFAHVFVLFAVDGAFKRLEGEDFFVPEDDRIALEALLRGANALPEQMTGLGDSVLYDVLTRADQTTFISFPRAERGASHTMHPRLSQLGLTVQPEFRRTAGPLEYAHTHEPTHHAMDMLEHRVEPRQAPFDAFELEESSTCGLRAWAKRLFPKDPQTSLVPSSALEGWRRAQRRENLAGRIKTPRDTAPEALPLDRFDPTFAAMLTEQIEQQPITAAHIQQPFERISHNIRFVLDGLRRENHSDGKVKRLEVYRIVETLEEGFDAFRSEQRHREWWFADIAMQSGVHVSFHALDPQGNSKFVMNPGGEKSQKRLLEARAALARAQGELERGVLKATPGFHCYNCGFKDLCRESA